MQKYISLSYSANLTIARTRNKKIARKDDFEEYSSLHGSIYFYYFRWRYYLKNQNFPVIYY
jgi:hypothetical protein